MSSSPTEPLKLSLTLPLRLRRGARPLGPTRALLVPGSEVARWCAVLAKLEHGEDTPLYPLPVSRSDPQCAGLLVLLPTESIEQNETAATGVPFRQLGQLLLPVDAELLPALTAEELDRFFAASTNASTEPDETAERWLFHPGLGLIRFEDRDTLRPSDLLTVGPPRTPADSAASGWSSAQPGVSFADRLERLQALVPPVQASSTLGRFMKDSEESGDGKAGKAGGKPGSFFRRMLGGKDGGEPDLSGSGSAGKHDREIKRLLDMIKNNPDKGLRHALPIGGLFRGRGGRSAGSGARLDDHGPIQFSLGNLFGGGDRSGSASFFSVGPNLQQRLRAAYLEAANRELELGRFGRAAYIFGELLGDLHAAANALEQGRLFRDAAEIHARLGQHKKAAACLERGGYFEEAAELYLEHKEHEKAGALFRRIGMEEAAEEAYHTAMLIHRNGGRPLKAAKILHLKLGAPDAAIDELEPFPGRPDCLDYYFRLLGETGEHQRAGERVSQLRRREDVPVQSLVKLTRGYPDQTVREQARQTGRAIISESITHENKGTLGHLLQAFAPEDKLLPRDLQRFYDISSKAPDLPRDRDVEEIVSVHFTPQLPDGAEIIRYGSCLVSIRATRSGGGVTIQIWNRRGEAEVFKANVDQPEPGRILFAADPGGNRQIRFIGETVGPLGFEYATARLAGRVFSFESPPWLPPGTRGMAVIGQHLLAAAVQGPDGLDLQIYNANGTLIRSDAIWPSPPEDTCEVFAGGLNRETIIVRWGGSIHAVLTDATQRFQHLDASNVLVEGDTVVCNTEKDGAQRLDIERQTANRVADYVYTLLPQHAIGLADGRIWIFSTRGDSFTRRQQLDLSLADFHGARCCPTDKPNEFVLVGRSKFRRFRFRA